MIWKNFQYNWLDLSPSNVYNNNIALSNVTAETTQRSKIVNNVNDHWSKASNTLEGWRLLTFEWYIFGITKDVRWEAWSLLNSHINIEPYVNVNPFKRLDFQTDEWNDRWLMAKVEDKPKWENGVNDSRIAFSFELFCNTNEIYWTTLKSITGASGVFGGTSFPDSFWDSWGASSSSAVCNNAGNFKAGCTIQAVWTLINPKVKNITNWQEFKIDWTTTNLVVNSLSWNWEVTDEWLDIMYKRDFGVPIFLSPWDNVIIVTDDTGTIIDYTVSWYDTWNTL